MIRIGGVVERIGDGVGEREGLVWIMVLTTHREFCFVKTWSTGGCGGWVK